MYLFIKNRVYVNTVSVLNSKENKRTQKLLVLNLINNIVKSDSKTNFQY